MNVYFVIRLVLGSYTNESRSEDPRFTAVGKLATLYVVLERGFWPDEVLPSRLTAAAESAIRLRRYPWPGNIRELENVIERAVILSSGPVLRTSTHDLSTRIVSRRDADRPQTLEEVERKHILTTLKETRWTLSGPSGAAARLGLNRSTLYFRMKKLGIARSLDASFEP